MKKGFSIVGLAVTCLLLLPYPAWAWSGKVVGVSDGDTITVLRDKHPEKIRLYGIDCPEKRQPFGKKAKQFTSDMVFGKIVQVNRIDTDRYGRTVAFVIVDNRILNEELVRVGLAWVYDRYCYKSICESWKDFQFRARLDKRGLWGNSGEIPPWEYRRRKRW
jgi:endonuclease YncB( thermonuclease family)